MRARTGALVSMHGCQNAHALVEAHAPKKGFDLLFGGRMRLPKTPRIHTRSYVHKCPNASASVPFPSRRRGAVRTRCRWGMVLDAGLAAKSLSPKTVLLTHGHRDHVQALPAMARPPFSQSTPPPKILLPAPLEPLVRQFLLAESQLNFGKPQTEEENYAALGQFDLLSCADGDVVELPKHAYLGRDGLCVEALRATHKDMPALSYGIFRKTKKLKPEFAAQRHRIKQLLKESPGIELTEIVNERLLFYTGDTTIELLEQHAAHILSYKYIVHECSFLGPPSKKLDQYALQRGHTHYAQLHPYICSAPNTTFILVHWSIRYSREDVEAFFEEQYGGVPENVVLWI
eukprot:6184930-Pleurochrysis_carterae.AAC.3